MHKILYVDDEPGMREIATLALEREPTFEVRACASGAEALDSLDEWRPDLVMLDVVMPDMDGPATLARMRATECGRHMPVVFITARSRPEDVEQLVALGAAGVIAKPFNPRTLADDVKAYLRQP
jgi:CheY-like chemotaxis protein